jgi:ABC-type amino acid transport substrate-binding protein
MFISKKYPKAKELLKEIDKALTNLKNDGTLQKLKEK